MKQNETDRWFFFLIKLHSKHFLINIIILFFSFFSSNTGEKLYVQFDLRGLLHV